MCPRHWWDLLWFYDKGVGPPKEPAQVRPVADILWRLFFYATCLPVCYPCYLTRTLRKRTNDELREVHVLTLENGVDKVLFQTVATTKTKNQVGDPSSKQTDEIEVNVIILKSATGRTLQRHLYGDDGDQVDGPPSNQPLWLPPLRRSVSMEPELEVIHEGNEGAEVQAVQLRRGTSDQPLPSRPSIQRRWSHAGAAHRERARLSRRKKDSNPAETEDFVEDEDEKDSDEKVTLRKHPRYLFYLSLVHGTTRTRSYKQSQHRVAVKDQQERL